MKRKMITMILAIGLVLSQTTNFTFAKVQPRTPESNNLNPAKTIAQDGGITTQNIRSYSITFSKSSNTKATGTLKVFSSTTPSSIKATIRLQVSPKGSASYQNASVAPIIATVNNKSSLSKSFTFPITTAKKYRVMATVVETVNGKKNTYHYYKTLS